MRSHNHGSQRADRIEARRRPQAARRRGDDGLAAQRPARPAPTSPAATRSSTSRARTSPSAGPTTRRKRDPRVARAGHAPARRGDRPGRAEARGAGQLQRGRLLRPARGRAPRRGHPARRRLPGPRCASPGSARPSRPRSSACAWCSVRTGVVLDPSGGALSKMLLPFKLGGGGPVAGGRQYMPWIHVDDVVGIYLRAIDDPPGGAGQRHRPRAGHEQGVQQGARPAPCTARPSRRSPAPRSACSTATWPRSSPRASGSSRSAHSSSVTRSSTPISTRRCEAAVG